MKSVSLEMRLARWLPILVSIVLALLVLGPLLKPGYILTLDMVFGPNGMHFVEDLSTGYPDNGRPLIFFTQAFSTFFPINWFQKVLLILVLVGSTYFATKLSPAEHISGKLFAGIIYAVNPFVYTRFLAGSLRFLLAYALAPLALITYINLVRRPSLRTAIMAASITTLVGVFSIQIAVMLIGMLFLLTIFHMIGTGKNERLALLKGVSFFGLFWFVLNIYWLPYELVRGVSVLDLTTTQGFYEFTSIPHFFNIFFTLFGMYGFWRPGYTLAPNIVPWVLVLLPLFLSLLIYGFLSMWRQKITLTIMIAAIFGFLLAAGTSGPLWPITDWFQERLPFLKGFRDSQRLILPLVIAYSYFGGVAVSELWNSASKLQGYLNALVKVAAGVILITPLIYTFTMIWGFNGFLNSHQYPSDWAQAREIVDGDAEQGTLLFLPWTLYLDFDWLSQEDKRLLVPARAYFERQVIHSEDPELGAEQADGFWDRTVKPILSNASSRTDLGYALAPLGVRYILLSKTWEEYSYVYEQNDLELILEGDTVALFRNLHPVSIITQDAPAGLIPLRFEKSSWFGASSFTINSASAGQGLFFVPPLFDPSNWRLNGVPPLEPHLPVYFSETSGAITYGAAPYLFIGRIVSFISLVIFLAVLIRPVWLKDVATSITVGSKRLYALDNNVVNRGI